jgi:hypothetical protein
MSAMTFTTPAGSKSLHNSPKRRVVSGVVGAGFTTTVFPASSAGARTPCQDPFVRRIDHIEAACPRDQLAIDQQLEIVRRIELQFGIHGGWVS